MPNEQNISNTSSDVQRLTTEYLDTKSLSDKIGSRLDELKLILTKYVVDNGSEDEKGNLWLPVGQRQLKRERRVSISFDEEAAEAWAREQGIFDEVKKVVTKETVDLDLLLAYAWEHREVSGTIESFNKEKVTWAFKVVEKPSFIDES